MSSVDVSSDSAPGSPPVNPGEMRLEVVVVLVSDVDRAKRFYESLGWRSMPTSRSRRATASSSSPRDRRVDGTAPGRADYGSFVAFSDPDGNGWLLQEIKTRLPGR